MRRIAHISDLHFGTVDPVVADNVVKTINELEPHLVVVSGDLTQRARTSQFVGAKQFLDRLPQPQIVVPGNHDVPMYNVFDRFISPLEKYRRYITDDLTPRYIDDEIAVIGINTTRSFTIKDGRINEAQIELIQKTMAPLPDTMLKVIVTHHPFDLPEGFDEDDIVGRAAKAMPRISKSGADVFLAGHLHVSHIVTTATRYKLEDGHSALVVQAGTATSHRVRGEPHSFNVLEFERPRMSITRYESVEAGEPFTGVESKNYEQSDLGWNRID